MTDWQTLTVAIGIANRPRSTHPTLMSGPADPGLVGFRELRVPLAASSAAGSAFATSNECPCVSHSTRVCGALHLCVCVCGRARARERSGELSKRAVAASNWSESRATSRALCSRRVGGWRVCVGG